MRKAVRAFRRVSRLVIVRFPVNGGMAERLSRYFILLTYSFQPKRLRKDDEVLEICDNKGVPLDRK